MRALLSLLLICSICCLASAQKPRVLLAPVEVTDSKVLPDLAKKEAIQLIGETVEAYIAQQLHAGGVQMVKAVQPDKQLTFLKQGLKGNAQDVMETLEAAGEDALAEFVVVVQLTRWSQRDRTPSEITRSSSLASGSETKVELRLWVYSRRDKALFMDGSKSLEGTASGSHIGTQKRGELSGLPVDVAKMIQLTNKRRMTYIGMAAWAAIKDTIGRTGMIAVGK
jgi:hypothetical protein